MLNRYYQQQEEIIILDTGPKWSSHFDSNLVCLDNQFHKIALEKGVGIYEWTIENSSNGGPDGNLILVSRSYH